MFLILTFSVLVRVFLDVYFVKFKITLIQWNAEIRASSDFGQTTLVWQQNHLAFENIRNPNDFVQISDFRTIDFMLVPTFQFRTFLLGQTVLYKKCIYKTVYTSLTFSNQTNRTARMTEIRTSGNRTRKGSAFGAHRNPNVRIWAFHCTCTTLPTPLKLIWHNEKIPFKV